MHNTIFIFIILFVFAFFVFDRAPSKHDALEKNKEDEEKHSKNWNMKTPQYILLFMVVLVLVKHILLNSFWRFTKVEKRLILAVCEDKSDWEGYTTVDIEEVTQNNIEDFKDAILVLDVVGSK